MKDTDSIFEEFVEACKNFSTIEEATAYIKALPSEEREEFKKLTPYYDDKF